MNEIRYYKGKWKVELVLKSKGNYRVKALEPIRFNHSKTRQSQPFVSDAIAEYGDEFVTVPRLLWRHPRK